jgi:hypothetical protein
MLRIAEAKANTMWPNAYRRRSPSGPATVERRPWHNIRDDEEISSPKPPIPPGEWARNIRTTLRSQSAQSLTPNGNHHGFRPRRNSLAAAILSLPWLGGGRWWRGILASWLGCGEQRGARGSGFIAHGEIIRWTTPWFPIEFVARDSVVLLRSSAKSAEEINPTDRARSSVGRESTRSRRLGCMRKRHSPAEWAHMAVALEKNGNGEGKGVAGCAEGNSLVGWLQPSGPSDCLFSFLLYFIFLSLFLLDF